MIRGRRGFASDVIIYRGVRQYQAQAGLIDGLAANYDYVILGTAPGGLNTAVSPRRAVHPGSSGPVIPASVSVCLLGCQSDQ